MAQKNYGPMFDENFIEKLSPKLEALAQVLYFDTELNNDKNEFVIHVRGAEPEADQSFTFTNRKAIHAWIDGVMFGYAIGAPVVDEFQSA